MSFSLVSIIIPVYNREHLISETLESVLAQTYTNWECIIVDDESTDSTLNMLHKYLEKDSRFKCFSRPLNKFKGANACRNYGFDNSAGSFIIWFDSDDLMLSNHIELKVEAIINSKADFVISKTANFTKKGIQPAYVYSKPSYGIRAEDFILRKIHWYTYDVMLSRSLAQKVSFNEILKSWQDYNYFCKMLLISTKGKYIDAVLTHRRVHSDSIQVAMNKTKVIFNLELLEAKVYTYLDIVSGVSKQLKKEYLFGLMNICFFLAKEKRVSTHTWLICKEIKKEVGVKSLLWFLVAAFSAYLIKKGEFLLNKAKKK